MSHRFLWVASLMFLSACNPLACFAPAGLPRDAPIDLVSSSAAVPTADVDIVLDDLGIPHVYGQNEVDLAYALGVLHARDRQFQVFVFVHAGEGRLTELLGEDLLPVDRDNRILTWHLDEQIAAMSPRDLALLDAYAQGLNDEAVRVGPSAEMRVLGAAWETLTVRDVMAVMRLQQWSQSVGMNEELARWRLAQHLGVEDPRFIELTRDTPSRDNPIVSADEHSGAAFTDGPDEHWHAGPARAARSEHAARSARASSTVERRALVGSILRDLHADVAARFAHGGTGLSNAWAVDGAHNASGAAVLCNDPHVDHRAPGVFYLVHLETPDTTIAGGSFPGIPAVLIGHGRKIAWGITNAYADTQDLVVLRPAQGRSDMYELDGAPMNYVREVQRFRLGSDDDAPVVEETFLTSVFGPVLPVGFGLSWRSEPYLPDDEHMALQWTAFSFPAESTTLISAFVDMARATTIDEVDAAMQRFAAPAMNVSIALADDSGTGHILYRLNGIVPVRGDRQRVDFPRDGGRRSAGWIGVLPAAQKPQLTDPARGFFVAANQRIVDNGVLSQRFVGYESARPWRASRIRERLDAMLANGATPTPEELFAIQQDVTSIATRELAPVLGRHCPAHVEGHDDSVVQAFCNAVRGFDGAYTVDATALPYARLERAVEHAVLRMHVGEDDVTDLLSTSFSQMSLHDLVLQADAGTQVAIFDDPTTSIRESLDDMVARGAKDALDAIATEVGSSMSDWRWGRSHVLQFRGLLARAPVIGGLFVLGEHEEAGTDTAPRAEAPSFDDRMRVHFGAGLRLFARVGTSAQVQMISDLGENGNFGGAHVDDQRALWTTGEVRTLARAKDDVTANNDGLMRLSHP